MECPNCGPGHKLVWKESGDGVCGVCGGTFKPGPEPKLVGIGEFDVLKGKVEKLEADNADLRKLLAAGKPVPDAAFAAAEVAEADI
jgi:hypothetical protein